MPTSNQYVTRLPRTFLLNHGGVNIYISNTLLHMTDAHFNHKKIELYLLYRYFLLSSTPFIFVLHCCQNNFSPAKLFYHSFYIFVFSTIVFVFSTVLFVFTHVYVYIHTLNISINVYLQSKQLTYPTGMYHYTKIP